MYGIYKDIQEADVVITIKRGGLITIIKNRDGNQPLNVNLAGLLEIIKTHQPKAFGSLIDSWISKYKNYRAFM